MVVLVYQVEKALLSQPFVYTMVRALHLHLSRWLHIVDICCTPNSPIL